MMKTQTAPFNNTLSSLYEFPLLAAFARIWEQTRCAFAEARTHAKGLDIALGLLTALGRRTISRGICARGEQFEDWSAQYRFFSEDRWSVPVMQHQILGQCARHLEPRAPLVIGLDDTTSPKTGKKIPASGYFYDSKSPPFARSFKWALRYLSASVMLTPHGQVAQARGVMLRWNLAPTLPKPARSASKEQKAGYRRATKLWSITTQALEQVHLLRAEMDAEPALAGRLLVVAADGSYTNSTLLGKLPERCVFIGRTRGDLKVFAAAENAAAESGRPRLYGKRLPTPEQIRQDPSYPWEKCTVFAAGKWHELRYKSVAPVLWENTGGKLRLRLIVIEPLGYRLRKNSKLLYKKAAYLLVSDVDYPVQSALQHYFHRWEIEVNHREAKDTLGLGDAQVRKPLAVARAPAFVALIYSMLTLASLQAYGPERGTQYLPRPKWRNDPRSRPSALDMVSQLRLELWSFEGGASNMVFSGVPVTDPKSPKYTSAAQDWLAQTVPRGISQSAWSAILYADA